MKIKKNDQVVVLAGADKGKTGKVLAVFPKTQRVLVEGINFIKKHQRQTSANAPSGIIEKEAAIHVQMLRFFMMKSRSRLAINF